jgi:hypothetical protein
VASGSSSSALLLGFTGPRVSAIQRSYQGSKAVADFEYPSVNTLGWVLPGLADRKEDLRALLREAAQQGGGLGEF